MLTWVYNCFLIFLCKYIITIHIYSKLEYPWITLQWDWSFVEPFGLFEWKDLFTYYLRSTYKNTTIPYLELPVWNCFSRRPHIYSAFFKNGYPQVKIRHFPKYSKTPSRKNVYLFDREIQRLFDIKLWFDNEIYSCIKRINWKTL